MRIHHITRANKIKKNIAKGLTTKVTKKHEGKTIPRRRSQNARTGAFEPTRSSFVLLRDLCGYRACPECPAAVVYFFTSGVAVGGRSPLRRRYMDAIP